MRAADFRLTIVAALTWVGIVVSIASPGLAGWLCGAGIALIVWASLSRRKGLFSGVLILVGLGLMGALSVVAHHPLRFPVVLENLGSQPVELEVVMEKPAGEESSTLWGRIHEVSGQPIWPTPVMVRGADIEGRVIPGSGFAISGSLQRMSGLDSRAWVMTADSLEHTRPPGLIATWADSLRQDFATRSIERGGDGGALLPGLALGDTVGLTPSLQYDMRRAGLAHLVAVSGANCAIVVALAVGVVAVSGGGVWLRLLVGSVVLVGFVILVTPEPSVVRAAVMASAVLCAGAFGRPALGIHVLSLTVWVLLLIDPWRSVEISFALSVAATAGILVGFSPTASLLSKFLPTPLAVLVALPLAAQLAVTPLIVVLRPSLPTYGVIANVLVAPLAPIVTVVGLAGCLAGPVLPALADALAWLGWWPASGIAAVARGVGQMPLVEIPWLGGIPGLVAAALMSAGWWLLVLSRYRRLGGATVLATIAWVITQTVLPLAMASSQRPREWHIAQCDVGQGDSVLINTSEGVIAIDTGDDEGKLRQCLQLMGISDIRLLILTHFDTDHVAQSHVFRGITDEVWSGHPENREDWQRMSDLEAMGARWRIVAEGDLLKLGNTTVSVLWPSTQPLAEPGNDSSVTIVADISDAYARPLRLLALGDLGEQSQLMLVGRVPKGPVDVVKVSHHGSADQSPALYWQIDARIGLIGAGADNTYGHPTQETLELLEQTRTLPVRTDLHHTSVIGRSDEGLWVWSSGGH